MQRGDGGKGRGRRSLVCVGARHDPILLSSSPHDGVEVKVLEEDLVPEAGLGIRIGMVLIADSFNVNSWGHVREVNNEQKARDSP
jgi:hypothetical protein